MCVLMWIIKGVLKHKATDMLHTYAWTHLQGDILHTQIYAQKLTNVYVAETREIM